MSGTSIVVNLRCEAPSVARRIWVPAAAETAGVQATDKQRAQDAGFDHHLVKPVEPAALLNFLESISSRQAA
jgi:CheY-like chemotaxis protein